MKKTRTDKNQMSLFDPIAPTVDALDLSTTTEVARVGTTVRVRSADALASLSFPDLVKEQIIRDSRSALNPNETDEWKQFYIERAASYREYLKELQG